MLSTQTKLIKNFNGNNIKQYQNKMKTLSKLNRKSGNTGTILNINFNRKDNKIC